MAYVALPCLFGYDGFPFMPCRLHNILRTSLHVLASVIFGFKTNWLILYCTEFPQMVVLEECSLHRCCDIIQTIKIEHKVPLLQVHRSLCFFSFGEKALVFCILINTLDLFWVVCCVLSFYFYLVTSIQCRMHNFYYPAVANKHIHKVS